MNTRKSNDSLLFLRDFKLKIISNRYAIVAVAISLLFATIIFVPNLFNLAVPNNGDLRAHIFKIDFLYQHLSHGSIASWNPYWYDGIPFDPAYPPLFYYLGALLTFITRHAVISYKLLMFLTMISNGLAAYFLARIFLKMKPAFAIVSLIAFETSTAILVNYSYGTIPDLMGWTFCVFFLGFYLNNIMQNRIFKAKDILIPGILFGLTILTHPFPAIFGVLAVVLFHLVYMVQGFYRQNPIRTQLRFFILVFSIGILISSYYWIPFLLNRNYISPIYTTLGRIGTLYAGTLCIFSLIIACIARRKTVKAIKLDILLIYVTASAALGFGLTRYMPFGLDSLLHSFRFATIMLPFFCILLTTYSLEIITNNTKIKQLYVYAVITCFLLLTSVIYLPGTYASGSLTNLFSYIRNYLQPSYGQLLDHVQGSRLIVPAGRGRLSEGDSPVTFGWHYGVETVNGPFNQGDPKFFLQTVYLEWEEQWLNYDFTRENLMQESAAGYLFIRRGQSQFENMQNLNLTIDNNYGQLWTLNEPVQNAVNVTPILLDVSHPQQVMEYFNILVPQGYKIIFVNTNNVNDSLKQKFDYVMVDDIGKIAEYNAKNIFVLENSNQNNVTVSGQDSRIIRLSVPYIDYSNEFFYHGDKADGLAWTVFDQENNHALTQDAITSLYQISSNLNEYLQKLEYRPAEYQASENNIEVKGETGFTLIKNSYYPYWQINSGELVPTNQGFMLAYSDTDAIQILYTLPVINLIAGLMTISSLAISSLLLVVCLKKKPVQT